MKIGIDLGGTNARVAAVDGGKIVRTSIKPTPKTTQAQVVTDALIAQIAEVSDGLHLEGIGIGVPSVVDSEQGIVYNVTNIPSWREVHLRDILQERFHVPVAVNNDANCFALGEQLYGPARNCRSVVGLTLGTGVGAGLILDGKLYSGRNTAAGEICSLPYLQHDYEHYCSSGFFIGKGTTGKDCAQAARQGDAQALAIWAEFGTHIAELIKATLLCYDPEAIVLGGSIAKAYPLYQDAVAQGLKTFLYPTMVQRLSIYTSSMPDVALYGAAALI